MKERGTIMEQSYTNAPLGVQDMGTPPVFSPEQVVKGFEKMLRQIYNRTSGAMCLHLAIMLIVQIIFMVIFTVMLTAQGVSPEDAAKQINDPNRIWMIIMLAAGYLVAHLSAYFIGLKLTGRLKGASKLFQKPKNLTPVIIIAMIFATFGLQSISALIQTMIQTLIGSSGMEGTAFDGLELGSDMVHDVLLFIYIVILGPVGEEIIMRGMMLRNTTCTSVGFGITFSAVMFGIFHGNVIQFVIGVILGLLFGYIAVSTGSIIPTCLLHIMNNGYAFLNMVLVNHMSEESFNTYSWIWIICTSVLGIISVVYLVKKFGRPAPSEDSPYAPVYPAPVEEKKSYKWRLVFMTPCFWIFTAIYAISAISAMGLFKTDTPTDTAASSEVTTEVQTELDEAAIASVIGNIIKRS